MAAKARGSAVLGLTLIVSLSCASLRLALATTMAASKVLEWPDPKTGTALGHITVCTVNRKNHTRHTVAAAGGAVVAWQHTWRSLSYQMVEADTPMSWSSCLASCVYKAPPGFTMLTIESEDENEVIRTLLTNTPGYNCTTGLGRSAWLGVTDLLQEGNMTYLLDGAPLRYVTWAALQPNNDGEDGQDCLRILSSGTLFGAWEDISCNIVWGAQQTCICRRDNSPPPTEARYVGVAASGKKYWTLNSPRSWEGCRIGCLREAKGRMAIAATEEDYNSVVFFAGEVAKSLNVEKVWLGATDIVTDGDWNWLDGTHMALDSPWAPEQPDNARILEQKLDEDGLTLHTSGKLKGLYSDDFIGRMAACLCETEWQATSTRKGV